MPIILGLNDHMPFGKHKGKLIKGLLVVENISYLEWFTKTVLTYKFDNIILDKISIIEDNMYEGNSFASENGIMEHF